LKSKIYSENLSLTINNKFDDIKTKEGSKDEKEALKHNYKLVYNYPINENLKVKVINFSLAIHFLLKMINKLIIKIYISF